jgi:hypothetical protein
LKFACRLAIGGNFLWLWPVSALDTTCLSSAVVTPQVKGRQTGVVIGSEWKRQEPLEGSKTVVAKASYLSFCSLMATATDGGVAGRLRRSNISPIAL